MTDRVVVKDIAALDAFAGKLGQAKASFENAGRELQAAMSQVGGQWEDPQRDRCQEQVDQMRRQVSAFASQADQQIAYVRRLAAHLRSAPRP